MSGPGVQIGGDAGGAGGGDGWGANALTEKAWKGAVHLGTGKVLSTHLRIPRLRPFVTVISNK